MAPPRCKRCQLLSSIGVDGQVFHDPETDLYYDVSKARAIIEALPRDPIEVPPVEAFKALLLGGIHLGHVRHVDIKFPSIVIKRRGRWMFIDGNHRAYQRLFKRLPIKAYRLNAREVRAILNRK